MELEGETAEFAEIVMDQDIGSSKDTVPVAIEWGTIATVEVNLWTAIVEVDFTMTKEHLRTFARVVVAIQAVKQFDELR